MKLTVLGGSAAGPNTGQGCSGLLVEVDGPDQASPTRLVLDLGPGTLPELRRHADYRTLDAVVISHLHLDHVLDLAALRFALAYNPVPPPRPLPLWLPPGGLAFLDRFAAAFAEQGKEAAFFRSVFSMAEYDPAAPLRIGVAEVRFAPTVHYVPCWAIRVAARGKRPLVYTADTGPSADLAGFAGDAHLLVAEATLPEPPPDPPSYAQPVRGHLTAGEAADLATRAGAERLLLTHTWEEVGVDRYRQAAQVRFVGPVEVAQPGLTVQW